MQIRKHENPTRLYTLLIMLGTLDEDDDYVELMDAAPPDESMIANSVRRTTDAKETVWSKFTKNEYTLNVIHNDTLRSRRRRDRTIECIVFFANSKIPRGMHAQAQTITQCEQPLGQTQYKKNIVIIHKNVQQSTHTTD